jgi:hypothetical protein
MQIYCIPWHTCQSFSRLFTKTVNGLSRVSDSSSVIHFSIINSKSSLLWYKIYCDGSCLTALLYLKIDVVRLRHLADLPLTPAPTPPPHLPCPAFLHGLHRSQQSLQGGFHPSIMFFYLVLTAAFCAIPTTHLQPLAGFASRIAR